VSSFEGYITDVNYKEGTISGKVFSSDDKVLNILLIINEEVVAQKMTLIGEVFSFYDIDFDNCISLEVCVDDNTKTKLYKKNNTTILLARQRTGTNVLRRFLNSHQDIYSINEVFDPGIYSHKNFETYEQMYMQISKKQSDLIGAFFPYHYQLVSHLQKPISYKQAFCSFLDYINLHTQAEHNIIDIKYNHLHNLTNFITPLLNEKKDIFDIIKKNKIFVINLIRKNYLKSYISGQLASKSGNYVLSKESQKDEHKDIMITVDVDQLLYSMGIMKQEDEFIAKNLKDYKNYIHIEYGEMFNESGEFDIEFSQKISNFFNVSNTFNRAPSLKKLQDRPLKDIIVNYNEVVKKLTNTPFEYCLFLS